MTTVEVLRNARALIEDPERWCKRALRKRDGRCCAVGAVLVAEGAKRPTFSQAEESDAVHELAASTKWGAVCGSSGIAQINDGEGHSAVLDLFDRTIKRLEDQS